MDVGKQKTKSLLCIICALSFLVLLGFFPSRANATTGINQELSFEGKMVNASGINITDGSYNVEFKIYSGGTATGGGTLVWTEDWLVHNSQAVTFTSGTFQVNLGAVTAFGGSVNWNSNPLYLSIQIGNTSNCTISTTFQSNCGGDGEMTPYILLTATPYAMNSNQLGGLTASQFVQLAPGSVQVDSGTTSSIFINKTGASGNILELQNGGTDVATIGNAGAVTLQPASDSTTELNVIGHTSGLSVLDVDTSNGRVGIGTNAPTAKLYVSDSAFTDNFNRANNTSLGANWTKVTDAGSDFQIVSNQLKMTSSDNGATAEGAYTTQGITGADYTVQSDIVFPSSSDDWLAVMGRASLNGGTDTNGYYAFAAMTNQKVAIYKRSGSTWTQLGSSTSETITAGNTYTIKLVMSGTTLSLYWNGVLATSTTDSTFTSAGFAGIAVGQPNLANSIWDNFSITSSNPTVNVNGNTAILGTGQLGVGTTTPQYMLDVAGSARVATTASNSTTAFQVQNASSSTILDVDTTNGRVGIGTAAPSFPVEITSNAPSGSDATVVKIDGAITDAANFQSGLYVTPTVSPGSASSQEYIAVKGVAASASSNLSSGSLAGFYGSTYWSAASAQTLGFAFGFDSQIYAATTGNIITNAIGIRLQNANVSGGGTVTNSIGALIQDQNHGGTSNADLVIGTQPASGNYAVYSSSAYQSSFAGSITTPTLQSAAATALTITGNAASTWSTSSGNITLQAGGGTVTLGTTGTLTSTNGLTITGGSTLSLGSTTSSAISLDSGTTGAVNVGTGTSGSKTIQIGTVSTNTGNTQTIGIGNTNVAGTTNITIGTGTSATGGTTTVQAFGALTLTGGASSTWSVGGTNQNLTVQASGTGTLALQTAGAGTVSLQAGANGGLINIGNNAFNYSTGTGIQIGQSSAANTAAINIGNNSNASGSSAITIGTAASAGSTVAIEGGTGASAILIGNGATAHGIQIGTGAAIENVTIGSTNTSSKTLIQGGTNNINFNTNSSSASTIVQTLTNSATAFQVQNAVAAPIFIVDSTSTMANGNTLNYLTYPGFESGSFSNAAAGWAAVAPATLSQNNNKLHTFNGTFSAQVVTTASNGGLSTTSFVSAPPSGTYIVSFYAKVSSGTMASTAFTVQSTDGATHTCSPASGITINSSGFQRLFCSITTTGAMTAFQITQNDGSARTIYIDSVQLQSNSFNGTTIAAPTIYNIGNLQLRGTITNPLSISPNGDSTTAFQVQKSTGANVFDIDTLNGRLGIGTTTPTDSISIPAANSTISMGNGAGSQINMTGSPTSSSVFTLYGSSTETILNTLSGGDIALKVANATKIFMNSSGQLGLNGNTSPGATLDLSSGGTIQGAGLSSDCSGTYSRLLWSSSTKQFSCGTTRASYQFNLNANQSNFTTTTLADATNMNLAIGSNETWIFYMNVALSQSTGTDGYKFNVTSPSGSTCNVSTFANNKSTISSDAKDSCNGTGVQWGNSNQAAGDDFILTGVIANGSTAGNVQLQLADWTAGGTVTIFGPPSFVIGYKVSGADYAEIYYAKDHSIGAGDVVAIDPSQSGNILKTTSAYQSTAMGIVSTEPGQVIGAADGTGIPEPIALNGRVPVKVSTINGDIQAGDYLTPSNIPGVAMKATQPGQMIARALTSYSNADTNAIGVAIGFVDNTWADPGYDTSTGGKLQGSDSTASGSVANTITGLQGQVNDLSNKVDQMSNNVPYLDQANVFTGNSESQFKIQNTQGQTLLNADAKHMVITVANLTVTGDLTLHGHTITSGTTPTTTILPAAGVDALGANDSTCSITGNDTNGSVILTTGSTHLSSGAQCTITFAKPFSATPQPVFSATNRAGANAGLYVNSTPTNMTMYFSEAPEANRSYDFNYWNAQ